ncbi:hypothetical protein FOL47_007525 [Perkinsus chesapeaki]|uniref:Domain of unknown function at the cortex 1 domain-containing protein n=1 Tax=Perkinsus chesapeaki TaxID=330153 RepID=A0A7J6LJV0_PERCH|nr:hypothetical protein FOL47_007525 [Perkinsus chesapeaki]
MSISKRLASVSGSELISNFPNTSDDDNDSTRTWFLFPLTSADTVIEHDQEHELPDITADEGIYGKVTAGHQFDTEHVYTFCYWSMFVDFVTWDLRNLPAISVGQASTASSSSSTLPARSVTYATNS